MALLICMPTRSQQKSNVNITPTRQPPKELSRSYPSCPPLNMLDAAVNITAISNEPGAVVQFGCPQNYILVGSPVLACTSVMINESPDHWQWNATLPKCMRKFFGKHRCKNALELELPIDIPWDYLSLLWSKLLDFFSVWKLSERLWKVTPRLWACAPVITLHSKMSEKDGFRRTKEAKIYNSSPQISYFCLLLDLDMSFPSLVIFTPLFIFIFFF